MVSCVSFCRLNQHTCQCTQVGVVLNPTLITASQKEESLDLAVPPL